MLLSLFFFLFLLDLLLAVGNGLGRVFFKSAGIHFLSKGLLDSFELPLHSRLRSILLEFLLGNTYSHLNDGECPLQTSKLTVYLSLEVFKTRR